MAACQLEPDSTLKICDACARSKRPRGLSRLGRLFQHFGRDRRGATAVEFGLVAIPFLGLLLATFEIGFVFFANEGLAAATQDAARNMKTGTAQQANITTADQFRTTYLCPATGTRVLPSFIDCSKLIIDVRAATSFASVDTTDTFYLNPKTTEFCPAGPSSIMVVRVVYPMPVMLPVIGYLTAGVFGQITTGLVNNVPSNAGWKHLLMGTAVFQTEPYPGTSFNPTPTC